MIRTQIDLTEDFYNLYPFPQCSDEEIINRARTFKRNNPELAIEDSIDVLDAGCGTGTFSNQFALFNPKSKVYALNISQSSIDYAESQANRLSLKNIEYIRGSLFDIKNIFEGRKFDFIYSQGVLHHTPRPMLGLKTLIDALKPGGVISIGLYHLGRYPIYFKRKLLDILVGKKNFEGRLNLAKKIFPRGYESQIRGGES